MPQIESQMRDVMMLRQLLCGFTRQDIPPIPVSGVAYHSKQIRDGEVFVAVRGTDGDGHDFLDEAVRRGASALIVRQRPVGYFRCPVVVVEDTKKTLAALAARFYGNPASQLRLIGVTGTNGKTTVTYLMKAILEAAGHRVGLLGTVAYQIGERSLPAVNTTPGPLDLQRHLAEMVKQWLDWCVMEVSSHALDQQRIEGLTFDAAVFTNLGSDHLDYHGTLERYAQTKRRLFTYLRGAPEMSPSGDAHAQRVEQLHQTTEQGGLAVINADDAYGQTLAASLRDRAVVTYGIEPEGAIGLPQTPGQPPMVCVREIECSWQGIRLVLDTPWGVCPLDTPIVGRHNVSNIAAACAVSLALGVPMTAVRDALANFLPVPGRMERMTLEGGVTVIIDYAHTADALKLVLLSLRELVRGRLIVVFGCGGNRDHLKRSVMGRISSLLADQVVLTSDNPRSEDPLDIIHQIKAGFVPGFRQYQVVLDREQAIESALAMANANDLVLVAGKGHEAYQLFDHVAVPFSDREVVTRLASHAEVAVTVS